MDGTAVAGIVILDWGCGCAADGRRLEGTRVGLGVVVGGISR